VACYLRALQINSEYAKANNNLGNALEDLGQLENAVASYRRALEIEPDLVEAHCNLGNALRDLGQLENAVASYHQALEIKPGYAMAHNNLGLVLLSQGKLDNALEKFRRAVEIKPDFADAQCNLGSTLQSLGRFDVVANMYGGMEINLDTEYCDENGQPGRPSIRKYNNRKGAGPGKCARMGLPRYWINTATRSLVLSDTDFAYQGLGPPINLTRTYNSNAPVRIPANVTSDSGNVTANSGERDRGVGVARFDSMPSCFFG
jgi:tetratricopeptide (TPR) repeat protein